jgi:hypothetical protein
MSKNKKKYDIASTKKATDDNMDFDSESLTTCSYGIM